jgi:hypothetical protein
MQSMYVPTIDHPLWPFAVLLVVFIPVSLWHERNWRATLDAYAHARRAAGAPDEPWPAPGMGWVLGLQPWLLLAVSMMLAAMVALGTAAMVAWPHRLLGFDEVLNYFDRPYLAAMLAAGYAVVIAAVAVAIDLIRSPWSGVANQVRRCTYASAEERQTRFDRALACDPGVQHTDGAGPTSPSDSSERAVAIALDPGLD